MRCNICDVTLSDKEIQWSNERDNWEPCTTCIHEADSLFNDDSEQEIDEQLELELGDEDEVPN